METYCTAAADRYSIGIIINWDRSCHSHQRRFPFFYIFFNTCSVTGNEGPQLHIYNRGTYIGLFWPFTQSLHKDNIIPQCPNPWNTDIHLRPWNQVLWRLQSSPDTYFCQYQKHKSQYSVIYRRQYSPPGVPVMITLPFCSVVPCDKYETRYAQSNNRSETLSSCLSSPSTVVRRCNWFGSEISDPATRHGPRGA